MFDKPHFSDQISSFNQLILSITPCQDNMCHMWFFFEQEAHHLVNIEIAIAQGDIDFIQQNEFYLWISDKFFGRLPSGGRCLSAIFDMIFLGDFFSYNI